MKLSVEDQMVVYRRRMKRKELEEKAEKTMKIEFHQKNEEEAAEKRLKLVEHFNYQGKDED